MKVIVKLIKGKDLKPGDLFSKLGKDYWDKAPKDGVIGEKVFIRTDIPLPADQVEKEVYQIYISPEA